MNLTTAEKFLILAHRPEKGGFAISHLYIEYGIAGAIVMDLALDNIVEISDGMIILKKNTKTDNKVFSDVTSMIAASAKPRKIRYWISRIARKYISFKWQILGDLAGKRKMRIEKRSFLGIIPYRRSYLTETITRDTVIQDLKKDILYAKEISPGNMNLIGLLDVCRMHRVLAGDRDELKRIRKRSRQVISEMPVAGAVSQTISQLQAAIIASVTAAIVASTAGRH